MGSYLKPHGPWLIAPKRVATLVLGAAAVALLLLSGERVCQAQQGDNTLIGDSAFAKSVGHVSVNEVSGAANQETNAAVVSSGPAVLGINQSAEGRVGATTTTNSAQIGDNAFQQSSGMMQVTQASGVANMLANAAFVGVDGSTGSMGPVSLSQVSNMVTSQPQGSTPYQQQTGISPTAFSGANGVVQVDQTAGNNNLAANQFALHFEPGTVH